MTGLLGQILVWLTLAASVFGATIGFSGGRAPTPALRRYVAGCAYVCVGAALMATIVLEVALVRHDFGVSYVAQVGSVNTPLTITLVSLWSALEGSMLFYLLLLAAVTAVFAYLLHQSFAVHATYALATMLCVTAFFALLVAGPASPFQTVALPPHDGPGPNPLLQNHALMIVHPPLLYLGFVSMTLPFAVAIAALLRGELSFAVLRLLRRTLLVAFGLLSAGIIVGAWWAYDVLGWGGYWAWDPVENASLLPWLATTGCLHGIIVQERKAMLQSWTLTLAMVAFLLTVLGTFMTRSGVFNSVHAFTQSAIGPMLLVFLGAMTLFAIVLLATRAHLFRPAPSAYTLVSRETSLLVNNVVLVAFTFTVLLGTAFPLVAEAVRGTKLSVGEPYFNFMAVPAGLLLLALMGIGPSLPWGQATLRAWRPLIVPAGVGILVALAVFVLGWKTPLALLTFGLCGFAATVSARTLLQTKGTRRELALRDHSWQRRIGGHLVHIAIVLIAIAVCGSQLYKQTVELSLAKGQSGRLGPYRIAFQRMSTREEAHRVSVIAEMDVWRDNTRVAQLTPALSFYSSQREPLGSPSTISVNQQDLYLSLMSFERDGSRVTLKAFIVPLVSYLFWALPVLVLGTLIALWPRRANVGRQSATTAGESPL